MCVIDINYNYDYYAKCGLLHWLISTIRRLHHFTTFACDDHYHYRYLVQTIPCVKLDIYYILLAYNNIIILKVFTRLELICAHYDNNHVTL